MKIVTKKVVLKGKLTGGTYGDPQIKVGGESLQDAFAEIPDKRMVRVTIEEIDESEEDE